MTARNLELCELKRGAGRPLGVTRGHIKGLAVIAIVIGVAAAIVYGESWAIVRAPASGVATALARATDLRGALDVLLAARPAEPGAKTL